MKKVFAFFLALFFCVLLAGCSSNFPDLYKKAALNYIEGLDTMTLDEAEAFAKTNGYEFEDFAKDKYWVLDGIKNYSIILTFNHDILKEVFYHDLEEDIVINITTSDIYYLDLKNNNKEFNTLAECENYVFHETSGVDFTIKK